MEQFSDVLKWSGLDPALFGIAGSLTALLCVSKAYIGWVNSRVTFALACGLACLGALVKIEQHSTWQVVAVNSIGLILVQLVGEPLLEKLPFMPKNNQFVPKPPAA